MRGSSDPPPKAAREADRSAVEPEIRERIDSALAMVERQEEVRILLAVESGSRAWGFSSPDSDYDVRFLYARKPEWYLSIDPRRDVIERPLDGDLDFSGWDIKKALQLLLKGNAVLVEWLNSPIRYREEAKAVSGLGELAARVAFHRPFGHHYLHHGASSYRRWIAERDAVSLKKYFYALRPAIALHWLRTRSDPPPMDLPSLRAGLKLPGDLSAAIDDLIARKAARSEMGSGPRIDLLDRFIEAELAVEPGTPGAGRGVPDNTGTLRAANRLFHDLVTS